MEVDASSKFESIKNGPLAKFDKLEWKQRYCKKKSTNGKCLISTLNVSLLQFHGYYNTNFMQSIN